MPLPIVPLVVAGAVGVVAWRKKKNKCMTPERKKVFEALLKTQKDPQKLKQMANTFEKEGCKAEANVLRKRAGIFSAPPQVIAQRKEAFKKAMASKNPTAIQKVAAAFHNTGHFEAASKLRAYSKGLFGKVSGGVKIGEEENSEFASDPEIGC